MEKWVRKITESWIPVEGEMRKEMRRERGGREEEKRKRGKEEKRKRGKKKREIGEEKKEMK